MPASGPRRPYPWLEHLLLCLPLLLVIAFCGLERGWGVYQDIAPYLALRDNHDGLTLLMRACSNFIYPLFIAFWVYLLIRGILDKDQAQNSFMLRYIILMLVVGVALPQTIKHLLALPRPGVMGISPGFPPPDAFKSFPSGHTSAMVALALPLALRYPRLIVRLCAALGMALVGYSRIWLLRHHPVDILAGVLVGSLVSWLAWYAGQGRSLLPWQKTLS